MFSQMGAKWAIGIIATLVLSFSSWAATKIESNNSTIHEARAEQATVLQQVNGIEKRFDRFETRIDKRFDKFEDKLDLLIK